MDRARSDERISIAIDCSARLQSSARNLAMIASNRDAGA
jgi:hypothetical protein